MSDPPPTVPDLARGPVAWVAGGLALLLVALSGRYGPHRDELYFVAAGGQPAWGYPDQPPFSPMLAWLTQQAVPGSVVALHVPSALAAAALAVLAALSARELGGGARAQVLAALATGLSGVVLAIGHILSTTTFDALAWALVAWLALRTLRRDEPRGWLLVGLAGGVGLLNKSLVAFLLAALVAGVALSPRARHHLRSPWAGAGALVAAALWAPNLVWQHRNGWPQLELSADIRDEYGGLGGGLGFLAFLLIMASPLLVPVWGAGLVRLWRDPALAWARPLAWVPPILLVVFLLTGGKGYYLAGLLPLLLAAGALTAERWHASGDGRRRRAAALVPAAAVLGIAPALPGLLPVLPERVFAGSPYTGLNEDAVETIGWPDVVAAVAEPYAGLPADRRARAVVVTGNYGEAGALAWYREHKGADLPPAYSGHNGFGLWGPPPEASRPVVVVGGARVQSSFTGCREVSRIDTGVDNEEDGTPVALCDGPDGTWASVWPGLLRLEA